MNDYKKSLNIFKQNKRNFYKTYEKGKDDKKIYKGSTTAQLELSQNLYLNGVSCFVINDENKVLIERRANTKLTANEIDLCSGHTDNNETPTQAMIREYVEELHSGGRKTNSKRRSNKWIKKIKRIRLNI